MLPAECNYEIFDKELLAIVNAFETWSAELGSVEASTLMLTDHKNLEHFTTTKKLNRRQARWNELIANYDFKIVFRPGKQGGKPDALTRISSDKPIEDDDERNQQQYQILIKSHQSLRVFNLSPLVTEPSPVDDQLPTLSLENWNKLCDEDQFCTEIRAALNDLTIARKDIQLANCRLTSHSFKLDDKEYVPESLRETLLRQLHENPLYGHQGTAALYKLLTIKYWWPNCHKDVAKYTRGCHSCL